MPTHAPYTGRFAPTPSGPLHQGSLVAALGSWLAARSAQGHWLVRIEDLDPPRTAPGAAASILHTLERLGLHWDGPVVYQSQRAPAYQAALAQLQPDLFWCTCTRAELRQNGGRCPDTCRQRREPPVKQPAAARIATPETLPALVDGQYGTLNLPAELTGQHPILKRKDGLWSYPLAVVVDDAWQDITQVVRGADLLPLTPMQLWLQARLGYPQPCYMHLPLVRGPDGRKLSKQNQAPPIDPDRAGLHLHQALQTLGLTPPSGYDPEALLDWGVQHWPERQRPAAPDPNFRHQEAPWA